MRDAGHDDSINDSGSSSRVYLFEDVEIKIDGCGLVFEEIAWSEGYHFVAGVDEVGRGCLAGPVVAAACVLDRAKSLPEGLNDSKQVEREKREDIAAQLKEICPAIGVGIVDADEIDRINILEATKLAMRKAIVGLAPAADYILVDAVQLKGMTVPQRSIIKGDSVSASIAAASILAKTFRDALMHSYHAEYPHYGFAEHVGYATKTHRTALQAHGPCPLHRRSFRGVIIE